MPVPSCRVAISRSASVNTGQKKQQALDGICVSWLWCVLVDLRRSERTFDSFKVKRGLLQGSRQTSHHIIPPSGAFRSQNRTIVPRLRTGLILSRGAGRLLGFSGGCHGMPVLQRACYVEAPFFFFNSRICALRVKKDFVT
jgi:hypothetical protein